MSDAQNGRPASDAAPLSSDHPTDHSHGTVMEAAGEPLRRLGVDAGATLVATPGRRTLLSHPLVPQGRQSLFRR